VIRRTVVDDEDLEILKRLAEHTIDRAAQRGWAVEDGNYDANSWGHW